MGLSSTEMHGFSYFLSSVLPARPSPWPVVLTDSQNSRGFIVQLRRAAQRQPGSGLSPQPLLPGPCVPGMLTSPTSKGKIPMEEPASQQPADPLDLWEMLGLLLVQPPPLAGQTGNARVRICSGFWTRASGTTLCAVGKMGIPGPHPGNTPPARNAPQTFPNGSKEGCVGPC